MKNSVYILFSLFLTVFSFACEDNNNTTSKENNLTLCINDIDDDGDGFTDCFDMDCNAFCYQGDRNSDLENDISGEDIEGDILDAGINDTIYQDEEPDYSGELECSEKDDCVLVIRANQCCRCPYAIGKYSDNVDVCLVNWPDGNVSESCSVDCSNITCNECPEINGAECYQNSCYQVYVNGCAGVWDCQIGEICIDNNSDGVTECVDDPSICQINDDCQMGWHCDLFEDSEYGECIYNYGRCYRDIDCGDGYKCNENGECIELNCFEYECDCGKKCEDNGVIGHCVRECYQNEDCGDGFKCDETTDCELPECVSI